MTPEDIKRAREIIAELGTPHSWFETKACTLWPAALDECERLETIFSETAQSYEELQLECYKLRAENELLKSKCEFKQAILDGDNPDAIFTENDRYWLTGAQINKLMNEYYAVKAVALAAEKVTQSKQYDAMGLHETKPLDEALQAWRGDK